jgi:hypothetical protein
MAIEVREMYGIHDCLRKEFGSLPLRVKATADGDAKRASDVGDHASLMLMVLERHHTSEDVNLWPLLEARVPDRAELFGEMEGRRPLHPYQGWGAANAARRRAQVQRAALRIEQERAGIAPRTGLRAECAEAQQAPPIATPPQVLERAGRAIGGQLTPRRHRSRVRPHRCAPL